MALISDDMLRLAIRVLEANPQELRELLEELTAKHDDIAVQDWGEVDDDPRVVARFGPEGSFELLPVPAASVSTDGSLSSLIAGFEKRQILLRSLFQQMTASERDRLWADEAIDALDGNETAEALGIHLETLRRLAQNKAVRVRDGVVEIQSFVSLE